MMMMQVIGQCVASVIAGDHHWRITADAVVSVFARWTITVHGQ